jgi:hypothetical protein
MLKHGLVMLLSNQQARWLDQRRHQLLCRGIWRRHQFLQMALSDLSCCLTPELSRTDLWPRRCDNVPHIDAATKRSRLERIVRPRADA